MIKYLLRPFVLFFKAALRLVLFVLLVLRRPVLIILALFIAACLLATTLTLIAYYQGSAYTFDPLVAPFDKASLTWGIIGIVLSLIFWIMLEWVVPDGKKRPQAEQDTLQGGVVMPLRQKALKNTFVWKTEHRRRAIVVRSPSQGIYVEGSAGAGKSQSVIEPIIEQAAAQGFVGFLYDFKGHPPTLSSHLYGALSKHKPGVHFAHINLGDPAISQRCNPLAYLPTRLYAQTYASVILKNLNREWATKADFWAENAIAYLAAIIWYLKCHHPALCSLPHATLLALELPAKSLRLLEQDEEVKRMIGAISVAHQQQAEKQLAGVFSSLQIPMNKLYTKELFWLLASQEEDAGHVHLDVSHPVRPTFLSVGNDPRLGASFAPIIALLATVCMQQMNQQGKHKSVFMLDEAPTLFIPGLEQLPATARSNNLTTVLCVQDFAQLQSLYGHKLAEVLRNNLGNQFFGMTGNLATGEYVAKMAGEYVGVRWSYTNSSASSSDTASLGKEAYLTAHQVAAQPPGHFIVKVAGKRPEFFAAQLRAPSSAEKPIPVRIERNKLAGLMEENWKKIHQEMKKMVEEV